MHRRTVDRLSIVSVYDFIINEKRVLFFHYFGYMSIVIESGERGDSERILLELVYPRVHP